MPGASELPAAVLGSGDFAPTLTSVVVPDCKSRTKTSGIWFVSPITRLVAALTKATYRPSDVRTELRETPLPLLPLAVVLTSTVVPLTRSRTKTSLALLMSPVTRLLAALSNNTYRPFDDIAAGIEFSFPPPVPAESTLTRVVAPLVRSRRYTFSRAGVNTAMGPWLLVKTRLAAVLANRT